MNSIKGLDQFSRVCYSNILGRCASESKVDVAKLVADEITELTPLNVVSTSWTDGGGVRVGRNGGRLVVGPYCGRECTNTIIVHKKKKIKFLFILYPFFSPPVQNNIVRFKIKLSFTRCKHKMTRNAPLKLHLYALLVYWEIHACIAIFSWGSCPIGKFRIDKEYIFFSMENVTHIQLITW